MRLIPAEVLAVIAIIFAVGSTWMAVMDPSFREKYYGQFASGTLGALIGLAMPRKQEGGSE